VESVGIATGEVKTVKIEREWRRVEVLRIPLPADL
jgi:hypothetical protein